MKKPYRCLFLRSVHLGIAQSIFLQSMLCASTFAAVDGNEAQKRASKPDPKDWAHFDPYKYQYSHWLLPEPSKLPMKSVLYRKGIPEFPHDPARGNIIFGRGAHSLPTEIYAKAFDILQIDNKFYQVPAAGDSKLISSNGQTVTVYGTTPYTPLPDNRYVGNPAQVQPFDPTRIFYKEKQTWPSLIYAEPDKEITIANQKVKVPEAGQTKIITVSKDGQVGQEGIKNKDILTTIELVGETSSSAKSSPHSDSKKLAADQTGNGEKESSQGSSETKSHTQAETAKFSVGKDHKNAPGEGANPHLITTQMVGESGSSSKPHFQPELPKHESGNQSNTTGEPDAKVIEPPKLFIGDLGNRDGKAKQESSPANAEPIAAVPRLSSPLNVPIQQSEQENKQGTIPNSNENKPVEAIKTLLSENLEILEKIHAQYELILAEEGPKSWKLFELDRAIKTRLDVALECLNQFKSDNYAFLSAFAHVLDSTPPGPHRTQGLIARIEQVILQLRIQLSGPIDAKAAAKSIASIKSDWALLLREELSVKTMPHQLKQLSDKLSSASYLETCVANNTQPVVGGGGSMSAGSSKQASGASGAGSAKSIGSSASASGSNTSKSATSSGNADASSSGSGAANSTAKSSGAITNSGTGSSSALSQKSAQTSTGQSTSSGETKVVKAANSSVETPLSQFKKVDSLKDLASMPEPKSLGSLKDYSTVQSLPGIESLAPVSSLLKVSQLADTRSLARSNDLPSLSSMASPSIGPVPAGFSIVSGKLVPVGSSVVAGKVLPPGMEIKEGLVVAQGSQFVNGKVLPGGKEIISGGYVVDKGSSIEAGRVLPAGSKIEGGKVIASGFQILNGYVVPQGASIMNGKVLPANTNAPQGYEIQQGRIVPVGSTIVADGKAGLKVLPPGMKIQDGYIIPADASIVAQKVNAAPITNAQLDLLPGQPSASASASTKTVNTNSMTGAVTTTSGSMNINSMTGAITTGGSMNVNSMTGAVTTTGGSMNVNSMTGAVTTTGGSMNVNSMTGAVTPASSGASSAQAASINAGSTTTTSGGQTVNNGAGVSGQPKNIGFGYSSTGNLGQTGASAGQNNPQSSKNIANTVAPDTWTQGTVADTTKLTTGQTDTMKLTSGQTDTMKATSTPTDTMKASSAPTDTMKLTSGSTQKGPANANEFGFTAQDIIKGTAAPGSQAAPMRDYKIVDQADGSQKVFVAQKTGDRLNGTELTSWVEAKTPSDMHMSTTEQFANLNPDKMIMGAMGTTATAVNGLGSTSSMSQRIEDLSEDSHKTVDTIVERVEKLYKGGVNEFTTVNATPQNGKLKVSGLDYNSGGSESWTRFHLHSTEGKWTWDSDLFVPLELVDFVRQSGISAEIDIPHYKDYSRLVGVGNNGFLISDSEQNGSIRGQMSKQPDGKVVFTGKIVKTDIKTEFNFAVSFWEDQDPQLTYTKYKPPAGNGARKF